MLKIAVWAGAVWAMFYFGIAQILLLAVANIAMVGASL
jgi:hypothetical protein